VVSRTSEYSHQTSGFDHSSGLERPPEQNVRPMVPTPRTARPYPARALAPILVSGARPDGVVMMARSRRLLALLCASALWAGCSADVSTEGVAAPSTSEEADAATAPPSPTPVGPDEQGQGDDCAIPADLEGRDVERLPVRRKVVALTFDGGANADGVPSIRATLRRKRVGATFFLTGSFVEDFPVKSKRLAARDVVGNHTMTHPDLTTLSDEEIADEVRGAEDVIRTTTGEDPRRFFRFPFGARDQHVIDVVNQLCYVPFRWTVDSLGWKGTSGGQSVSSVVSRVVGAAQPGAIVLMHVGSNPEDGTTLDADALPRIVRKLRGLGFRLVRLTRVMAAAP
jgi:peptidoglycan/xylan/chitin deacetylase (PgdA/CDA1 family)